MDYICRQSYCELLTKTFSLCKYQNIFNFFTIFRIKQFFKCNNK